MLKKYTTKEWFVIFLMEWILPTLGKVFAIFTITAILFNEVKDKPLNPQINKEIENLYKISNSKIFVFFLMSTAIVLILCILAKKYSKGDDRLIDKFAKKQRHVAITINFLLGVILLPLVFAITIFEKSGLPMDGISILAIIYVLLSAVFHWLSIENMHPYAGILYIITLSNGNFPPNFGHILRTQLEDQMSHCDGSGSVTVLSETNDNQITLFVPVLRATSTFSPTDLMYWKTFLNRIESEWNSANIQYEKIISPTVKLALAI